MPRAFLIKKKKTYGLSSASSGISKKRASAAHFIGVTNLQEELCKRKEPSYDSESESGRSSVSSQIPSPSPSPNPPLIPSSAAALLSGSNLITDLYSRTSILEPLNLNANSSGSVTAALPWMKPFLTPYLPFNFPYHPHYAHSAIRSDAAYHPTTTSHIFATSDSSSSSSSISPVAHRIFHPHQGVSIPRGTLYPSRSEPPSPSCPCPLSPYTPPRDGTPTHLKDQQKTEDNGDQTISRDTKRTLHFADTRVREASARIPVGNAESFHSGSVDCRVDRSSPNYWTDQERCSSNGSIQSDGLGASDSVHDRTTIVAGGVENDVVQTTLNQQPSHHYSPSNGSTGTGGSRRRTSDGGPRYQCPDCNKSYSTYSGLSKHQQFHCATTNKKSFSCKYCDKVYMSLGALKMHIRTHTLPCKCKLCGKAFSRPWLLQGHIRTHTGEKPFACPHCNRAFADRSNLRAHLQTHSDVKKYSCKTCAKTFSRMSLLSKHEDGGCAAVAGTLVQERSFEP